MRFNLGVGDYTFYYLSMRRRERARQAQESGRASIVDARRWAFLKVCPACAAACAPHRQTRPGPSPSRYHPSLRRYRRRYRRRRCRCLACTCKSEQQHVVILVRNEGQSQLDQDSNMW